MTHLRDLLPFLLLLAVGARRTLRIRDSHDDAMQQNGMSDDGIVVSAEAKDVFNPGALPAGHSHRKGPEADVLQEGFQEYGDPAVSAMKKEDPKTRADVVMNTQYDKKVFDAIGFKKDPKSGRSTALRGYKVGLRAPRGARNSGTTATKSYGSSVKAEVQEPPALFGAVLLLSAVAALVASLK